jgi:cold shock CspA family protein/ribosome-associated translation inhibitor RaiA
MPDTSGQIHSENIKAWEPPRQTIVPEAGHDPYRLTTQFPEGTECPGCGAAFREGRWQWPAGGGRGAAPGVTAEWVCPACRRVADSYPAGFLTLSGAFLASHHDDVVRLLRNEESAERAEHPLNRVIAFEDRGTEIEVTTTDVHLPRRLAEAVRQAFEGEVRMDYATDQDLVRVSWTRTDAHAPAERPEKAALPIEIMANGIVMSGEVQEYLNERIHHLEAFYPRILSCRVVFDAPLGHHRTGGPFIVNVYVDVPGTVVAVTKQQSDDLHVAIRGAFDAAQRQLQDYARKQRGEVSPTEAPPRGRIVRLFADEGYGFIATADGRELYFHRNSVLEDAFDRLEVGTEVRFAEELGNEGPQASTVALLG